MRLLLMRFSSALIDVDFVVVVVFEARVAEFVNDSVFNGRHCHELQQWAEKNYDVVLPVLNQSYGTAGGCPHDNIRFNVGEKVLYKRLVESAETKFFPYTEQRVRSLTFG